MRTVDRIGAAWYWNMMLSFVDVVDMAVRVRFKSFDGGLVVPGKDRRYRKERNGCIKHRRIR
jgi:hypothetical protein